MNTITVFISCNETFKFSLVLRAHENTDVFIILDDNIYGIHSKRVNILFVYLMKCVKERKSQISLIAIQDIGGYTVNSHESSVSTDRQTSRDLIILCDVQTDLSLHIISYIFWHCRYCDNPKYWDTLFFYYTCPKYDIDHSTGSWYV